GRVPDGGLRRRIIRLVPLAEEGRDGDRRQQSDDDDDHQQLDEGEALLAAPPAPQALAHVALLAKSPRGTTIREGRVSPLLSSVGTPALAQWQAASRPSAA